MIACSAACYFANISIINVASLQKSVLASYLNLKDTKQVLTPEQQANLKAGDYLKVKGQVVSVDRIIVNTNNVDEVEFDLDDYPYRAQKNSDELSKPSIKEILAHRQKQLDQR